MSDKSEMSDADLRRRMKELGVTLRHITDIDEDTTSIDWDYIDALDEDGVDEDWEVIERLQERFGDPCCVAVAHVEVIHDAVFGSDVNSRRPSQIDGWADLPDFADGWVAGFEVEGVHESLDEPRTVTAPDGEGADQ